MSISMEDIKKLREETGAGVMDAKKALEESSGDYAKAKDLINANSVLKAQKKADRTAGEGIIVTYVHTGGKVASMVHLSCETDFVAKTEDFKALAYEIAKQVCAIPYEDVQSALNDTYIKDPSIKLAELITQSIGKMGEKIELVKFVRYAVKE